jgi:enoyl-CoA hydratase/carnithine racemase
MFLTGKSIPIIGTLADNRNAQGQFNMTTSPDTLLVEQKGLILYLTLNRPNKYNALSVELNEALLRTCESIPNEVAIVVLRGEGKHFCVGSDLMDLYKVDRAEAERVLRLELDACMALLKLPQLTVAVMHGKCYGGGAFLPLYCDFRIGRPGFELALPEVALGWLPPYGIERLNANVLPAFALDMLLTGRVCGDREAIERGWIQRLMTLEEETPFLEKLAQIPPRTLRDTLAIAYPKDLAAITAEDDKAMAAFLDHFDTDHARNKIASFVEKKRS